MSPKKCLHLQICPIDLDGFELFLGPEDRDFETKTFKIHILSNMGHICKICKKNMDDSSQLFLSLILLQALRLYFTELFRGGIARPGRGWPGNLPQLH